MRPPFMPLCLMLALLGVGLPLAGCQWQPLLSEGELEVNGEGVRLTLPGSSLQLFQATAP